MRLNTFACRYEIMNNYLMCLSGILWHPQRYASQRIEFKSYFWARKIHCKVSAYLLHSILDAPQNGYLGAPKRGYLGGPGKRSSGPGPHLSSELMSNDSMKSGQIGCKRTVTSSSTNNELSWETWLLQTKSGA